MAKYSDHPATGLSIERVTFDPYRLDYQRLTTVTTGMGICGKVVGPDSAVRFLELCG